MTKSTITRERAQQIFLGNGPEPSASEERELARMALAAMDSDLVATLDVQSGRPDGNKFALAYSSAAHKLPDDIYYLYRHVQPGSVLDNEPYGFTDGDRRGMIYEPQYADRLNNPLPVYRHAQPAPLVPEKATVGEMPFLGTSEGVYVRGWNDCRAAMLQELQNSAGDAGDVQISRGCRSNENVQDLQAGNSPAQGGSRCSIKAAPALDSSPKTAESRCGNSPVTPDGSASMLRRWLAFGRGMQNAGSQLPHNLIAETESMLAAATQEVKSES